MSTIGSHLGPIPVIVGRGGTGLSTVTTNGVPYGNATAALGVTSAGTDGQVLTALMAGVPAFVAIGQDSGLTNHGVILGQGNSGFAATSAGTTGQALMGNTGADPTFQTLPVPTSTYAFEAFVTATTSDVTGDGTEYTILYDTESYDIGSNFSSGTFTAPVNGIYAFKAALMLGGWVAQTSRLHFFVHSTGPTGYLIVKDNPTTIVTTVAPAGQITSQGATQISMTAGSTLQTHVIGDGSTKTLDVLGLTGSGFISTYFAGHLVQQL